MSYHFLEEINYEDLDDLPLTEHIEWSHENEQDFNLNALDSILLVEETTQIYNRYSYTYTF